jgi:hypothetical protein
LINRRRLISLPFFAIYNLLDRGYYPTETLPQTDKTLCR